MPLHGALFNPETNAYLRKLVEVVREAASQPLPQARPRTEHGPRPGWVAPLVLEVLQAASEPLTAAQVVREIKQRFGKQIAYDSVRHVLRFGALAQAGLIEHVGEGRYVVRRVN